MSRSALCHPSFASCTLRYHKKPRSATGQNKTIDKSAFLEYIFSSYRINLTKNPVLLQAQRHNNQVKTLHRSNREVFYHVSSPLTDNVVADHSQQSA
jgi:hypothetical protein